MGFFSNRISEESLKPGDHIYSWRGGYVYAHHGIYVGANLVIHFTCADGQETGTALSISSVSNFQKLKLGVPCPDCGDYYKPEGGVMKSCLKCFLGEGYLSLYSYAVKRLFQTVTRGGTCTVKNSTPVEDVLRRATYHLETGFGEYNLLKNNCESFSLYCKTGGTKIGEKHAAVDRSGQVDEMGNVVIVVAGIVIGIIVQVISSRQAHG